MDKPGQGRSSLVLVILALILLSILCIMLHTSPARLIGASICHQLPHRSPPFNFPLCYRCSGLFSGILWGSIFIFFTKDRDKIFKPASIAGFLAAFVLFLTDIINKTDFIPLHWYEDAPKIRFFSAYPLGFMLAAVIVPLFCHFFHLPGSANRLSSFFTLPVLLLSAGISCPIIFSGKKPVLIICGYFLIFTGLFFLTVLYGILIKCAGLLRKREFGDIGSIRAALILALLQVCILGGIHIKFLPPEIFSSYMMMSSLP